MLGDRPLKPWAKPWAGLLATMLLYLLTARLGLALAMPPEKKATAVWPPSGIALAALVMAGNRAWPAVWLGAFLANLWDVFNPGAAGTATAHLAISSAIASGSTLQAWLGASWFRRHVGVSSLLDRVESACWFVAMAPLMCLVAATVGVTALHFAGGLSWADYGFRWWTWWLGDTVGILVVAPLIWIGNQAMRGATHPGRAAEGIVVMASLGSVSLAVFGAWNPLGVVSGALAYMTVPLLVWATFRFGHAGAMAGLLLVSGMAIWGTIHGHGPFVQKALPESLLLLQSFVGVLAMTVLVLAAALTERRRAVETKAVMIQELEGALSEIRTLRGLIPICAWCKNIRTDAGSWERLEAYLREHTEAEFSHSICPECLEKRVGEQVERRH